LRHESGLDAHGWIAHLAFDLGPRRERGHGVNDDNVERTTSNKGFHNLECLLTEFRLRKEQIVDIDAKLLCISNVKGVLSIDERGDASFLLCFSDHVQADRCFSG
jgi:hypothetical protein